MPGETSNFTSPDAGSGQVWDPVEKRFVPATRTFNDAFLGGRGYDRTERGSYLPGTSGTDIAVNRYQEMGQGGPKEGPKIATGAIDNSREWNSDALGYLGRAASGEDSMARQLGEKQALAAGNAQSSMAASVRGGPMARAAAARAVSQGAGTRDARARMAINAAAAGEQATARGAYIGATTARRGQEIGVATAQAGLDQGQQGANIAREEFYEGLGHDARMGQLNTDLGKTAAADANAAADRAARLNESKAAHDNAMTGARTIIGGVEGAYRGGTMGGGGGTKSSDPWDPSNYSGSDVRSKQDIVPMGSLSGLMTSDVVSKVPAPMSAAPGMRPMTRGMKLQPRPQQQRAMGPAPQASQMGAQQGIAPAQWAQRAAPAPPQRSMTPGMSLAPRPQQQAATNEWAQRAPATPQASQMGEVQKIQPRPMQQAATPTSAAASRMLSDMTSKDEIRYLSEEPGTALNWEHGDNDRGRSYLASNAAPDATSGASLAGPAKRYGSAAKAAKPPAEKAKAKAAPKRLSDAELKRLADEMLTETNTQKEASLAAGPAVGAAPPAWLDRYMTSDAAAKRAAFLDGVKHADLSPEGSKGAPLPDYMKSGAEEMSGPIGKAGTSNKAAGRSYTRKDPGPQRKEVASREAIRDSDAQMAGTAALLAPAAGAAFPGIAAGAGIDHQRASGAPMPEPQPYAPEAAHPPPPGPARAIPSAEELDASMRAGGALPYTGPSMSNRRTTASDERTKDKGGANAMAGANRSMTPSSYAYKPGFAEEAGQEPGERNVGPMAQNMAADPVAKTAIVKRPDGMLAIDKDKGLKLVMGGLASVQEQVDNLERKKRASR